MGSGNKSSPRANKRSRQKDYQLKAGEKVYARSAPTSLNKEGKVMIIEDADGNYVYKGFVGDYNKKIDTNSIEYKRALNSVNVKAKFKADGSVDLLDKNNVPIQNIPNVSEVTEKSVDTTVAGETLTTNIIVLKSTDESIAKVLDSVNKTIAKQLDPIKNNIINAGEKWDNMASKVNNVLKKVYSKIGSANRLLEPTILYLDNNNNPNTLSTLGGRLGTRFVGLGSTTLYATSWTAELLAPAYLKSVYVKEAGAKVYLADGKTLAKTPFDGNKIIFDAEKAGEYTIVYKAIDYSGVEVEKTFKVNVVE